MRPRLLLVEDNSTLATLLEAALEDYMSVTIAATGRQAVYMAGTAETPFDMALVDMNLPDIRGVQAAAEIRLASPGTRIVLTSGNPETADLATALNHDFDGFIQKPFAPSALIKHLREVLRTPATAPPPGDLDAALRSMATARSSQAIVEALLRLAESRDNETGRHVERVGALSAALAEELAASGPYSSLIDADFIESIRLAAPLHDIGKVGISDSILRKPGRLTAAEFEIMRQHTIIGAEVMDSALRVIECQVPMLVMARDIVRHHHERWDGTGYPDRLKAEQIPLAARIVAVIDNYDALRSHRVYKPAYSRRQTRVVMRGSLGGGQFDPEILDVFEACEDRLHEIAQQVNQQPDEAQVVAVPG
jgi:putative two-component system response regulator